MAQAVRPHGDAGTIEGTRGRCMGAQRYEILDLIPDAVLVSDAASRVVFWNRAAEALYRLAAAEALGRTFYELAERQQGLPALQALSNTIRQHGAWRGEVRLGQRDGRVFRVDWSTSAFPLETGEAGYLTITRDITDAKRAHPGPLEERRGLAREREESLAELRRGTQELESLLEGSNAVLEGRDFNTTARRTLDLARGMIGAQSGFVALVNPIGDAIDPVFLESGGLPCAVDPTFPMPLRGLLGHAYATNGTVVENDFARSLWARTLPTGHVPLRNVLFVPLAIEGRTVGVLGLANKPQDFTAVDLRVAEAFGRLAAMALSNSRALDALQESERKYKLLYESAGVGIHYYAPDGTVISYNQVAAAYLRGSPEDFVGRSVREIYPGPVAEEYLRRIELACVSEQPGEFEHSVDLDAARRWLLTVATRIVDAHGKVVGVQFVSNDITARKQTDEALRRSEKNLAEAQRQTHIGSFEFHFQTGRLHWSDEMFRIFQVRAEDFGGAPEDFLHRVDPEDLPRVEERRKEGLVQAGPLDLEFRIVRPTGERRVVRMIFETMFDEHGDALRRVGTFQDITEQRRAEQDRHRLEAELQQAMKMEAMGRLAGGIAHDFNNLLTGITGNLELALMDLPPGHQATDILREIARAADSAAALTRQLLAFSRKQLIEPKVLDLNELIREMHKMLARLIGEDVVLETIGGNAPAMVKIDPGQLEQILVNLVVNARDAMPNGGKLAIETGTVELGEEYCSRHGGAQPGQHVMLAVSDTGHGMSAEVKAHLFEPFFTTKAMGKGTGLGLATVYGTVKQIGGFIEVYSELGLGTTLKIYLPRAEECDARAACDLPKRAMARGSETILLVEDEATVRGMAIRILRRLGYAVLDAKSGEDALALAERHDGPIHLLFTDVVMPGMNGRQLAERVRVRHPEIRVLFASGYAEDVIAHHGVIDAGLAFIGKPYAPAALAAKLRDVLEDVGP